MGIKNCVAIGNGGNEFNVPDYVEMEGNISAHNGGKGYHIRSSKTYWMNKLNLPEDVFEKLSNHPKESADVLTQLQGKSASEAIETVKTSSFMEKLVGVKDTSILAVNLVALSTHPNVHQFITFLESLVS